jgi:hypothetical protein
MSLHTYTQIFVDDEPAARKMAYHAAWARDYAAWLVAFGHSVQLQPIPLPDLGQYETAEVHR